MANTTNEPIQPNEVIELKLKSLELSLQLSPPDAAELIKQAKAIYEYLISR